MLRNKRDQNHPDFWTPSVCQFFPSMARILFIWLFTTLVYALKEEPILAHFLEYMETPVSHLDREMATEGIVQADCEGNRIDGASSQISSRFAGWHGKTLFYIYPRECISLRICFSCFIHLWATSSLVRLCWRSEPVRYRLLFVASVAGREDRGQRGIPV